MSAKLIDTEKLLPGDVLLMRSRGVGSALVARFADSSASHVAVVKDSACVVEVTTGGGSGGLRVSLMARRLIETSSGATTQAFSTRGFKMFRVLRHRDPAVAARVATQLTELEAELSYEMMRTAYFSAARRTRPVYRVDALAAVSS